MRSQLASFVGENVFQLFLDAFLGMQSTPLGFCRQCVDLGSYIFSTALTLQFCVPSPLVHSEYEPSLEVSS